MAMRLSLLYPFVHLTGMKPTFNYSKPAEVGADVWMAAFHEEWQHVQEPIPSGNANADWHWFCETAENIHKRVFLQFGGTHRQCWTRNKGTSPQLLDKGTVTKRASSARSIRIRRMRNLVGKLNACAHRRRRRKSFSDLWAKICRSWCLDGLPADIDTALQHLHEAMEHDLKREKQEAVARWRQGIYQQGKEATKWLNRHSTVQPNSVQVPAPAGGFRATTDLKDTFDAITDYWRQIWHRNVDTEELDRLKSGRLTRPEGQPMDSDWRLQPIDLLNMARQNSGAPGCDGWRHTELRWWPEKAWQIFLDLCHDWCTRNIFPDSWQHCRLVMLPKDDLQHGAVKVSAMRPICIQPLICRLTSSVMAKKAQQWVLRLVSPDVHGALRGCGIEAAIATLDQNFQHNRLLCSLDLAKAFDHMHPTLAIGLLRHSGVHAQWANHLQHMWSKQWRWMQMLHYINTAPELLETSVPQGCAMAPLAMVVLLMEAERDVTTVSRAHGLFQQAVFIDDRSFVTDTPQNLHRACQRWRNWCDRLGLAENADKMKIVCLDQGKSMGLRRLGFEQRSIVASTRVLGVDFGEHDNPTIMKRVEKAWRILQRLQTLPVATDLKRSLYRSRGAFLLSWGWWLDEPKRAMCAKWTTRIKKGVCRINSMASRSLWILLEGHWTDPWFESGHQAVKAFIRASCYWRKHGIVISSGN
eukprot:s46_g26.t1